MSYRVSKRSPSGKSVTRYAVINDVTGEVTEDISAREYRNRTEAARKGFKTLSQKQRAQKTSYTVTNHTKVGTVHHDYDLKPKDIEKRINNIIDSSPQFGYGMFLTAILASPVEGTRVRNGKSEKRNRTEIGTRVHRKHTSETEGMLDELLSNMNHYNIPVLDIIGFRLSLVDLL